MSPGNAEKPAPEQRPSAANPIEIPKFWRNPTPPDPTVRRAPVSVRATAELPKDTPKKIEAKAEPLRSLAPIQELTKRRMLIQEERGQDKPTAFKSTPPAASPVTWLDQALSSNATAPPKPILISTPPQSEPTSPAQLRPRPAQPIETQLRSSEAQPNEPRLWNRAGKIVAWFGRVKGGIATALVELARDFRSATVRGLSELDRRAKNIYDARALAKRMRIATQFGRTGDPVSTSYSGPDSQPQTQPEGTTATHAKRAAASLVFHTQHSIKAFGSFARNVRNYRVRIRIVGEAPPLRIAWAASRIRARAEAALRKNTRFLTPLLMAALSAVVALGMIGAVRHYKSTNHATLAQRTPLPAKSLASTTFAAIPSPLKPSAAVSEPVSVQAALRIPSNEKAGLKKPVIRAAASQKQIRRRPHHNADADYVAKDTYVYYGKP